MREKHGKELAKQKEAMVILCFGGTNWGTGSFLTSELTVHGGIMPKMTLNDLLIY